jgi:hypothetical protein
LEQLLPLSLLPAHCCYLRLQLPLQLPLLLLLVSLSLTVCLHRKLYCRLGIRVLLLRKSFLSPLPLAFPSYQAQTQALLVRITASLFFGVVATPSLLPAHCCYPQLQLQLPLPLQLLSLLLLILLSLTVCLHRTLYCRLSIRLRLLRKSFLSPLRLAFRSCHAPTLVLLVPIPASLLSGAAATPSLLFAHCFDLQLQLQLSLPLSLLLVPLSLTVCLHHELYCRLSIRLRLLRQNFLSPLRLAFRSCQAPTLVLLVRITASPSLGSAATPSLLPAYCCYMQLQL